MFDKILIKEPSKELLPDWMPRRFVWLGASACVQNGDLQTCTHDNNPSELVESSINERRSFLSTV